MILIVTRAGDEHTDAVVECLQRKKVDYVRFETGSFSQNIHLSIHHGNHNKQYLNVDGKRIELEDIRAVWYRRPLPPMAKSQLSPEDQEFVRDESRHVLDGLWYLLGDRFWVNPYLPDKAAHNKLYQLHVARKVGLRVPKTLITSDPNEALEFFESCRGEMIYKTFSNYTRTEGETGRGIYTTRVDRQHLLSRLTQVELGPCFFQEYIPKKVELRITIVGQRLFAAEIQSQKLDLARVDWRRSSGRGLEELVCGVDYLPEATEKKIHEFISRLGLVFGCLDFVVTPDDECVFLEINPNGQWLWVEEITGMPLLENFAELLIQRSCKYINPPRLAIRDSAPAINLEAQ